MLKKFYVMHPQFPPSFSPVKTRRKGNKLGRLVTVLLGKISVPLPRPAPFGDCLQEPNLAVPHTPRAPRREKRVGSSSAAASSRRKVGGAKGIDFGNIFRGLEALPASLPLRRAVPTCSRTICPKLEALQPRNKGLWSAQSHQFGTGGGEERLGRCRGHLWLASEMPQLLGKGSKKKKKMSRGGSGLTWLPQGFCASRPKHTLGGEQGTGTLPKLPCPLRLQAPHQHLAPGTGLQPLLAKNVSVLREKAAAAGVTLPTPPPHPAPFAALPLKNAAREMAPKCLKFCLAII